MVNVENVPPDVCCEILSRLSFYDSHNFRLICKSWNLICPDSWPCLMFSEKITGSWKVFHSLSNHLHSFSFPELMGAEICFSKYGWLLMARDLTLFFFNPSTKKRVDLPPLVESFTFACFTSPPTSADCYVSGHYYKGGGLLDLGFGTIKVGDEEWKYEHFRTLATDFFWPSACVPLFYNGMYYLVDNQTRRVGIFDPRKEENRWTMFDKCLEEGEEPAHETYTVEVEVDGDGEIWGVFVTNDDRRVSVKRLDFATMRWRKLDSLGDKCLYVSPYGSFAETCCETGGMANKIYFNKFHGESGVMYSLKTGMYHSVSGDFASKQVYGLTNADYGVWIKPTK